MIIDDLLREAGMSRYKLSKESGVAQTTISDICSGKSSMEKCSAGTLYKMAKALNVTVELLLEAEQRQDNYSDILNGGNPAEIQKAAKAKKK